MTHPHTDSFGSQPSRCSEPEPRVSIARIVFGSVVFALLLFALGWGDRLFG